MGTSAPQATEGRRQEEQARLDSLKTAAERNKRGQFATPPEMARSLANYALKMMGTGCFTFLIRPLAPARFIRRFLRQSRPTVMEVATGIELDPLFAAAARRLWGKSGLHIIEGDFTKQKPPARRFNLILTNPPYVRHHHLESGEKDRLKGQLARMLQMEISGLAGLYCYFLLLCHDWMEDKGLAVWLIPSEFMDVNYGVTLRRYLTERVTLLHIHRFCPTDVQFSDALVSSAVVVFRKSRPSPAHRVRFSLADQFRTRNAKRRFHSILFASRANGHSFPHE